MFVKQHREDKSFVTSISSRLWCMVFITDMYFSLSIVEYSDDLTISETPIGGSGRGGIRDI